MVQVPWSDALLPDFDIDDLGKGTSVHSLSINTMAKVQTSPLNQMDPSQKLHDASAPKLQTLYFHLGTLKAPLSHKQSKRFKQNPPAYPCHKTPRMMMIPDTPNRQNG